MPESRKRPGHPYRKPADIPASQRAQGRVVWAVLIGVFLTLIAFLGVGANWAALIAAAVIGAFAGYFIGKAMEKEASHK